MTPNPGQRGDYAIYQPCDADIGSQEPTVGKLGTLSLNRIAVPREQATAMHINNLLASYTKDPIVNRVKAEACDAEAEKLAQDLNLMLYSYLEE